MGSYARGAAVAAVTCASVLVGCVLDDEGLGGSTTTGDIGSTTTSAAGGGGATGGGGDGGATTATGGSSAGGAGGEGGEGGFGGVLLPSPTCADGIVNGLETDVDCGGDACLPCQAGEACLVDADCVTNGCEATGTCALMPVLGGCMPGPEPTCNDCELNNFETDIDCGGDDCLPCAAGELCLTDADCETNDCQDDGTCAAMPPDPMCDPEGIDPTCNDCTVNGWETDVDCGGDDCLPCDTGLGCLVDTDCASETCDEMTNVCVDFVDPGCDVGPDPTCNDCIMNIDETDVDCGGATCLPCSAEQACVGDADCVSGTCLGSVCQKGAAGVACFGVDDCASGICDPGPCLTSTCCG